MREAKRKGEERRGEGSLSSSQRRHREPLLPSTAFQCKHCHPICDRVNWFFDVSRKVLIEKKKRNTNLPFSTDSCLSTKKKKKFCCSQRASFRPFPSHPSLSQIPTTSLLSYITAFLGVMVVFFFFFFEGTNFHLLISQLKKKKMWECSRLPAATADQMEQQGQCLLIWEAI